MTVTENNITYSLDDNLIDQINLYKDEYSFIDDKDIYKFIKNVESLIRTSIEYKALVNYIKNTSKYSNCSVLDELSNEDVKIEVHHNTFTLYDYVEIVLNYYMKNKLHFNTFIIANDVIRLHYLSAVQLVPISTTIHEYIHSQQTFIKDDTIVLGNINNFYESYKDYMNENQLEKYNRYVSSGNNLEYIKNNLIRK